MKSNKIREYFLQYFKSKGHTIVPSSPLIPANDPTLLFTNAGMVQFKDVFLGKEQRDYVRATSSQRCVRAGGKHNDLENVGYTARHHTFFEMLGNFSFGDYFKHKAIHYAWDFLTNVLGLPPERLWVTVYQDDQEAEDIWLKDVGVSAERFSRCGEKDNFWSMGETGPCGPCTEIFYDHGPEIPGGPPGSPDEDADRYIEIWNLVFMQYDRSADGTLTPLAKQSVDTGMGLERLAAVLQGVHNNYETDLFMPIIKAAAKIAKTQDLHNQSLRVIADHIRSSAFLIVDSVRPSNEGRGYVLRRIIRRAIRHGHKLGVENSFFYKLVTPLIEVMGSAYPELVKQHKVVEKILQQEEEQFARTIGQGLKILEHDLAQLKTKKIPGETVFKLYDTYGFPVDLTADIARERGFVLDIKGLELEMQKQREQSKAASQFKVVSTDGLQVSGKTKFLGYEHLEHDAKLTALFLDGQSVESLTEGQQGIVVLDQTPFYAESGGQVGDAGLLRSDLCEFEVQDTQKQGEVFLHIGLVKRGKLKLSMKLSAQVDENKRKNTVRNHSATHLLHAALQNILGEHVVQKGSLVCADYLRFDFAHSQPLTHQEVLQIEQQVNAEIRANHLANVQVMSPEKAKQQGAMALFGEKYGDKVRVLSLGDTSKELCGGTHVQRTGDIGAFKIINEASVASGVRRVEAITGAKVFAWFEERHQKHLQKELRLQTKLKEREKAYTVLQNSLNKQASGQLIDQAKEINGIKLLVAKVDVSDAKALRDSVDQLKNKLGSSVVLLATVKDQSVSLVAGVSKDLTSKLKAGDLLNHVAKQVGGKGGGRPDMAQGGGSEPENLDKALSSLEAWILAQS